MEKKLKNIFAIDTFKIICVKFWNINGYVWQNLLIQHMHSFKIWYMNHFCGTIIAKITVVWRNFPFSLKTIRADAGFEPACLVKSAYRDDALAVSATLANGFFWWKNYKVYICSRYHNFDNVIGSLSFVTTVREFGNPMYLILTLFHLRTFRTKTRNAISQLLMVRFSKFFFCLKDFH